MVCLIEFQYQLKRAYGLTVTYLGTEIKQTRRKLKQLTATNFVSCFHFSSFIQTFYREHI